MFKGIFPIKIREIRRVMKEREAYIIKLLVKRIKKKETKSSIKFQDEAYLMKS